MTPLSLSRKTPFVLKVSFEEVINTLEAQVASGSGEDRRRNADLLQRVNQHPELREGIPDASYIEKNEALIHDLLADFFPEVLTNNEIKAVGIPFLTIIFNLTKRFRNILKDAGKDFDFAIRDFDDHQLYVLNCCVILNKIYGTQLDFRGSLFYDIPAKTGVLKHYRILYNADYLQIIPTERAVPITQADIDLLIDNYNDAELWRQKFPPESWILKGFSIITLFDATVENAVSLFKDNLLSIGGTDFKVKMNSILRSIFHIPDITLGFSVYQHVGKLFIKPAFWQQMPSFILQENAEGMDREVLDEHSYRSLISEKTYFIISDVDGYLLKEPQNKLVRRFQQQGVKSFILAPVFRRNILLGVLEVASERPKALHSINANRLEVVMPFLTDKVDSVLQEVERTIQSFIQEKFTTIHPSVNWKFRVEAKKYLIGPQKGEKVTSEIVFEDVYPLYGQVDVRGSSEARNESVQKDLEHQLESIVSVGEELSTHHGIHSLKNEGDVIAEYMKEVSFGFKVNTERELTYYIENRIHPLLSQIEAPEAVALLSNYFQQCNKVEGSFFNMRRKYERTIAGINEKLSSILEKAQEKAQEIFPHYYEQVRTDGIEHSLYIGSSISPGNQFDSRKLHALRLWQLRAVCEMEISHHKLMPLLPYALPVTSLLFTYHAPIDIRFRMDEKRFDVDGMYNVRYEVIKKRIDKARIKNSNERITKTGKITIVFSGEVELTHYRQHIRQLQIEKLLTDDVEEFDVEDLQGVSGLRALRVGVLY